MVIPSKNSTHSLMSKNFSRSSIEKSEESKRRKDAGLRPLPNKTLVIGAVEVLTYQDGNGKRERAGRLRLSILKNASEESIQTFLEKNVATGSTMWTDGWCGYSDQALTGYKHRVRVVRTPERARIFVSFVKHFFVRRHLFRLFCRSDYFVGVAYKMRSTFRRRSSR